MVGDDSEYVGMESLIQLVTHEESKDGRVMKRVMMMRESDDERE